MIKLIKDTVKGIYGEMPGPIQVTLWSFLGAGVGVGVGHTYDQATYNPPAYVMFLDQELEELSRDPLVKLYENTNYPSRDKLVDILKNEKIIKYNEAKELREELDPRLGGGARFGLTYGFLIALTLATTVAMRNDPFKN
jgi:hypothetical protein